jgi:hypothetical protein
LGFSLDSFRTFSVEFFEGDLMRRRSEYLVLLRPWSLSAFAAAVIAVMLRPPCRKSSHRSGQDRISPGVGVAGGVQLGRLPESNR